MGAGDIAYWADVVNSIYPPVGRLVAAGTQSLSDNTNTALSYTAEDRDSHNFHSTSSNPSRVTPNVAGVFRVTVTLFQSALVNGTTLATNVRFNGTTNLAPADRKGGASGHAVTTSGSPSTVGGANAFSVSTTVQVECNGVTDYWEHMGQQDSNGADDTNASSQFTSVMEWEYIRPLL